MRGVTKSALPLKFPYGFMEAMPRMSKGEHEQLKGVMRSKYAVHYTELIDGIDVPAGSKPAGDDGADATGHARHEQRGEPGAETVGKGKAGKPRQTSDPDTPDTGTSPQW